MPENTKHAENEPNHESDEQKTDQKKDDNWSADQREKSYYYDDSYGYEVYNPDEDDDDE